MKFAFVFLLLIDTSHLKGLQRTQEFRDISLRLVYPSFYNNYNKSCCKLYPGRCFKLLDSAGYTCDFLKGRVTKTEDNGWIEFKISNVQIVDGGYYRCMVMGTQNHIYRDYYVEVSEVSDVSEDSGDYTQSQPPLITTTNAPNTTQTTPVPTGPVLAHDHSDSPRVPWSFGLPLATIVSFAAMISITSLVGVIFCCVKAKRKQSNKCEDTLCESLKQEVPELSGIIYTTVDFKAHQKPTELYENLRMHTTQEGEEAPESAWRTEHAGTVEYSTLAIHT
ncbi:uncharacterized protein LOC115423059 [Sphaeramia orbicularis]|uniref:uncharacterized protein LOC115423059 n=1 Tax=Sphaeramia orbicularis TaxID=375764 RepID=UPI001180210F|nr:uncharacterized protein LOC115423059 [Sphaeramia orbicularis]